MPPVMVTACSAETRMALVNVPAPGNNEAAGALQFVELLQLKGCVVTARRIAVVQRLGTIDFISTGTMAVTCIRLTFD
jgi:hypothetical protein